MLDFLTEEAIYQKSSQELTALLYEASLLALEDALEALEKNDLYTANKQLIKANDIVQRLGSGLNYEAGVITDQLDALYNYIADRLVEANIKKSPVIVKEVKELVETLMQSWKQGMKSKTNKHHSRVMKSNAYEKQIMTRSLD